MSDTLPTRPSKWSHLATMSLVPAMIFGAQPLLSEGQAHAADTAQKQNTNITALIDKGEYWFERYRFDLAIQAYNKALLINPNNAQALRWQGLIDVAKGETGSANVWLSRLQDSYGSNNPNTIELKQAIELASTKRQRFSEIRYMATSDRKMGDWPTQLRALFDHAPLGDAAVQYYRLLNEDKSSKVFVRQKAAELVRAYPNDRRYRKLLSDLGATLDEPITPQAVAVAPPPKKRISNKPSQITATRQNVPEITLPVLAVPVAPPAPSNFEQGQTLSDQAQELVKAGQIELAIGKLEAAVALQPDYPWFRYDLATLLDDQAGPTSKQDAQKIMQEGISIAPTAEMRFACALLAARQNRSADALAFLEQTPRDQWTAGMSALERRISYGTYLDALKAKRATGDLNRVAQQIAQEPRWRAEPEVFNLEQEIQEKIEPKINISYESSKIDGSEGVSKISSQEVPIQVDLPLDANDTLFLRLDTLKTHAGTASTDATNFAQLGTVPANSPSIQQDKLAQNFTGQLLGVGVQKENFRADIGSTVGNYPINDWVGGLQWKTDIGDGAVRVELSRRMVTGSVLSTVGAKDPVSGESWGAAKRNGISAVYYHPITDKLDFVGIGRANLITGKHIPNNTELSLQGIISKIIYQEPGNRVELGASVFLWQFDKNLRFYTYGQGGYYSPQSFASLTFPVTWTGNTDKWSWRAKFSVGASQSREKASNLYSLNPEMAQAAAALGNPTVDPGGTGGGVSTALSLQMERQMLPNLIFGVGADIDRSEGYNPDRLQLYWKYSFWDKLNISVPPEGLRPYSRF